MELCNILETLVSIDKSVESMGVFIAYTVAWRVTYIDFKNKYPFEDEVRELVEHIKSKYSLESLKNNDTVRAYREFFWRIGIDPTKVRPSSEALIRRALRNSFPRINPIVDAGNIASAYTIVPIGMYDLDHCMFPLSLRLSRGIEIFRPIGAAEEKLERGVPILTDARGTVMHVYPHRDSIDTMIRDNTNKIIIIAAGVHRVNRDNVKKALELTVTLLTKIGWRWCDNIVIKP